MYHTEPKFQKSVQFREVIILASNDKNHFFCMESGPEGFQKMFIIEFIYLYTLFIALFLPFLALCAYIRITLT